MSGEVLAWNAGCMEELLEALFFQSPQPRGFKVIDHQGQDPRFLCFGDFRDGHDDVVLEVLGILAHPVSFIILRIFFLDFRGS